MWPPIEGSRTHCDLSNRSLKKPWCLSVRPGAWVLQAKWKFYCMPWSLAQCWTAGAKRWMPWFESRTCRHLNAIRWNWWVWPQLWKQQCVCWDRLKVTLWTSQSQWEHSLWLLCWEEVNQCGECASVNKVNPLQECSPSRKTSKA